MTYDFVTPTLWIDRAKVMEVAHIYARVRVECDRRATYRTALAEALRRTWERARAERTAAMVNGYKVASPEAKAVHAEIVSLQMKDRMTSADFDRLNTLREATRLAA